jgi:cation diffusion facilitator CzcD-associated flavoprotein CzcO
MPTHHIAIIGSGFAGLAAAIRLRQGGYTDIVVLERSSAIGGTWRDNTYPGCACDVPSHLYSYSFAPNPNWSRRFAPQPEIAQYLHDCIERFDIGDWLRLNHEVLSAQWDTDQGQWLVNTSRGLFTATILLSAAGPLSAPRLPSIPGLETFTGTAFHTAHWDQGHDLSGQRVGIIGTGASAVQLLPHIAPRVAGLSVFQRSAPWIVPRHDRRIRDAERLTYRRVPVAQRLVRASAYWSREAIVSALLTNSRLRRLAEGRAHRHRERQVSDPKLRALLTPDYQLGCKRVLLSDDFYPALGLPHVEVLTTPIAEIKDNAVILTDGTARALDTLIYGTGFRATAPPLAATLQGRDGRSLREVWREHPGAYLGTTVTGFPNFFLLVGPNTGLGHNSIIAMIEAQLRYILGSIDYLRDNAMGSVEVRASAQAGFTADVQRRMSATVWVTGGCSSWYLDAQGRNTTLWPGSVGRFRRATARFDPAAHLITIRQFT